MPYKRDERLDVISQTAAHPKEMINNDNQKGANLRFNQYKDFSQEVERGFGIMGDNVDGK